MGIDDWVSLTTSPKPWLRTDNTVVDLRNFQTIQVLRKGVEDIYDVYVQWLPEGDLEVRVSISGTSARFRVALEQ